MKTFHLSHNTSPFPPPEPSVVAVGFFDGVHKGHQQVIHSAEQEAAALGVKSAVMTFDPHPSVILKKGKQQVHYITPLREKEQIIEQLGIDYLFVVRFDLTLASLSPQSFVDQFFVRLRIQKVVAGFDFSYGFKGEGSMETLPNHAKGRFTHKVVDKVDLNEEKISSTRIRQLLDEGAVAEAGNLLGRPFYLKGELVQPPSDTGTSGESMTCIRTADYFYLPKDGTYFITIRYKEEIDYGMIVIEKSSTLHDDCSLFNLYLLSGQPSLKEKEVTVQFWGFFNESSTTTKTYSEEQNSLIVGHIQRFFGLS
ncbi:bifunctional riboflavin kinase/FAD synthetase [Halobacillus litoralis]|uniref:bifunctional riboflavin kinase/FAD synthetase n=1 Tax=Halobacillus litoralis TaxID=45668 RepID=UPI001CFCE0F3|nr:bifunctional riboflavin kinase/FAD synthetase [Halobacillus litoralis]